MRLISQSLGRLVVFHGSLPSLLRSPAAALTGLALTLGAQNLRAADALPLASLDPQAVGGVSTAAPTSKGELRAALVFRASENALNASSLGVTSGDSTLLKDAHTTSFLLGVGLSPDLQLAVGLHATFEHMSPEQRDELFPIVDPSRDKEWRGKFKETGFSGATLALRSLLLDKKGLRLGVMPFLESGAGERAAHSLTRSEGPKAGVIGLATYGLKDLGEVSLNLGYRYRDPEQAGAFTWRHEMFAKTMARAYLTREISAFVVGEGRRTQVSESRKEQASAGGYRYGTAAHLGLSAQFEDAEVQIYAGGHSRKDDGFGYGDKSYGVSLAFTLQDGQARPRTSYANDIDAKLNNSKAQAKAKSSDDDHLPEEYRPKREYDEMKGEPVDTAALIGKDPNDDFSRAEKLVEQHSTKAGEMSDDEKVTFELAQIKEAEAKAAIEREAELARERAEQRKKAQARAKEDEASMKEWMKEAEEEAMAEPGIDDEHMQWSGLEDDSAVD